MKLKLNFPLTQSLLSAWQVHSGFSEHSTLFMKRVTRLLGIQPDSAQTAGLSCKRVLVLLPALLSR